MRWFVLSLLAATVALTAQPLETLARAYRDNPTLAARAALAKFAADHPRDAQGPLARLAMAQGSLQAGRNQEALDDFQAIPRRLPELADFARYGAAQALVNLGRKNEAVPEFEAVAAHSPVSSLMPWAVLAAGNILLEAGSTEAALRLAARYLKQLPAPQGLFLYGSALEAAGRHDAAAIELNKVYYEYSRSEEAKKAELLLARLQPGPPVPPAFVLSRANKLMEGGEGKRAILGLQEGSVNFTDADKDLAAVRIGVARYHLRDFAGSLLYLKTLKVNPSGQADAERLLYIVESARRLERYADVNESLRQLGARHAKSRSRLQALSGAANRYLYANDFTGVEPMLTACGEFAPEPDAAACHWKITWNHYYRRLPDAVNLLRQHVERFPGSEDYAAALYFLARSSERAGRWGDAKAYYETVSARFPNFYYAVVSRERLRAPRWATIAASVPVDEYLNSLKLPQPGRGADFVMDDATRARVRRARLLVQAAADAQAQNELRFGMKNGAKPTLCGMELARMAQARGENGPSLRAIKGSVQGFLTWRLEEAPKEFWQLAFPLPYRESLEKYAHELSIDRYIIAGLIRQESEFDPGAISRANARGLTQVLPATGREVSRRLGIRPFTISLLHQPDASLRIGINYLRQMLDSFENKWFLTLAAYNAGPGRANEWVKWGRFDEPAEFIETIPFAETRGYVQTVLRNADLYRRIWGETEKTATAATTLAAADEGK